jgi:hypothetical protein
MMIYNIKIKINLSKINLYIIFKKQKKAEKSRKKAEKADLKAEKKQI